MKMYHASRRSVSAAVRSPALVRALAAPTLPCSPSATVTIEGGANTSHCPSWPFTSFGLGGTAKSGLSNRERTAVFSAASNLKIIQKGLEGTKRNFASESDKANERQQEANTETISVTFVDKDSEEKTIKVPVGMSMLEAAHENDIELEGACEGSVACSTCHVIVMDEDYYNKLAEPTDEENDMLDLAFGLTETSRLGCQVIAKPELDGMKVALPAATRNFAVDGYVPKPH